MYLPQPYASTISTTVLLGHWKGRGRTQSHALAILWFGLEVTHTVFSSSTLTLTKQLPHLATKRSCPVPRKKEKEKIDKGWPLDFPTESFQLSLLFLLLASYTCLFWSRSWWAIRLSPCFFSSMLPRPITIISPYPQCCFLQFQWPAVNCGPEANDSPLTYCEKVNSSLTMVIMPMPFPSLHLTIQAGYHLASSKEEGCVQHKKAFWERERDTTFT